MSKPHYAGIDIGSNAVRLLIKCENNQDASELLSKVQLLRVPIRLGKNPFVKGRIGKKKSKQLLGLMKAFRELMEIYEVVSYRACATSAMRDASNGRELVEVIKDKTGIAIEIIDGREEAELISSDLIGAKEVADTDIFLYVDVGGGSTELNLVEGRRLVQSRSFDIGTIRQLSGRVADSEWALFERYLREVKQQYEHVQIVGSGGNINKLLRLGAPAEREKINILPLSSLQEVYNTLSLYSSEERMIRFSLKPDRADVIMPAAEIFLLVGDVLEASGIIVPTKGLSDGIIESVYRRIQGGAHPQDIDKNNEDKQDSEL